MIDRTTETGRTFTRRVAVVTVGSGLGLAAGVASSAIVNPSGEPYRAKLASISVLPQPAEAQEMTRATDSGLPTRDQANAGMGPYRGLNVPNEFPQIEDPYYLPENYKWGSVDPATVPYYADIHEDGEVPEGADIIDPQSSRFVSGTFLTTRTAHANGWVYAHAAPDPLPRHPRIWFPWMRSATSIDKNHPEHWAVGGAAHKADVLMRNDFGSVDGLWGNPGDAPIRANVEYARNKALEELPNSPWHISVIGNCSSMTKETADVRGRILAELGMGGYINLPVPPAGVDASRFVLKTVTMKDGSKLQLTLEDYFGWMALIGSSTTMIRVPIEAGVRFIQAGEMVMLATEGHNWYRVGYATDGNLIRATDFGKAHRNYRLNQIQGMFIARRNGVHADGKAIVYGEMSHSQIIDRGTLLIRAAWPSYFYHHMFNAPKQDISEFLNYRARLRHPDVRMIHSGF